MKRALLLFMIIVSCVSQELCAQKVGVKTNLASDFALNPNIGLEVGLAPKWTLEVDGQFNAWTLSDDKRWKHWAMMVRLVSTLPESGIGYVTALVAPISVPICMADSIMSAASISM